MTSSEAIVIPATAGHSATIIALQVWPEAYDNERGRPTHADILQGLGGEAEEWESLIGPMFRDHFPWVKWILPNAPLRPITVRGGQVMRAWYDLSTFDLGSDHMDNESGMLETVRYLDKLIQQEADTGIPFSRTVLIGYSQGAGMTLLAALTGGQTRGQPKDDGWKLAGVAPLSGRVPLRSKFKSVGPWIRLGQLGHLIYGHRQLASPYASETPIFWAHGEEDTVVQYQYRCTCAEMLVAELSARKLGREGLGSPGLCFVTYSGLAHSVNNAELDDLRDFLEKVIPITSDNVL
ncbi:Alpha/Beta hydrolase protein [Lanmaoa asiatica]|nr:Alpha/Beta hydrolase protein [Lanmaoa asiatica]